MDLNNPVIKLCIQGARFEFEGKKKDACELYRKAWETATDDYEACIAAHYVARFQDTHQATLKWNQEALRRADAVGDERMQEFYPSLYVNLGQSYELVGNEMEAQRYFRLAADLGLVHHSD